MLFSHSGFMSVIEETQLNGTLLAIEEINGSGGVNGRELVPVVYDPASESAAFGHYAKRLMIEDRITTIPSSGATRRRAARRCCPSSSA
ncbi:transporter substrate-binding protein [Vineibacter terrae]|uniref:transporter substrate-binding protein n=1 Tax=Vineibacter terrae TaxID=2586908 RepID=UPI001C49B0FD|nr:transporter substrate-binding protein [Vineibacter terrae]